MNITQETNIEVTIAEGAEIGLDRLREQVAKEIENDGGLEEMKDEWSINHFLSMNIHSVFNSLFCVGKYLSNFVLRLW